MYFTDVESQTERWLVELVHSIYLHSIFACDVLRYISGVDFTTDPVREDHKLFSYAGT